MKRMDGFDCRLSVIGCRGKRAQQMTLGTIIAIVLGIAVLVFLIFGFSQGWNSLWDKVTAFGGGDVNVDTIKQACALACSAGEYAYCTQERTVNYEGDKWEKGSCKTLEDSKMGLGLSVCSSKDCDSSTVPKLESSSDSGITSETTTSDNTASSSAREVDLTDVVMPSGISTEGFDCKTVCNNNPHDSSGLGYTGFEIPNNKETKDACARSSEDYWMVLKGELYCCCIPDYASLLSSEKVA